MLVIDDINLYEGYNSNSLLKKPGVHIDWTPEMLAEWERCSEDPIYFIEKYVKLVHVDRGLIPFIVYPYQREIITNIHEERFNIVLTARQAGKTSSLVGYIVWFIIFNDFAPVALLANKGDTAGEILGRVKLAYQYIPKWMQQGVTKWNERSIELENGSRVIASSTSASSIRGYTFRLVVIDEAAHIENWHEFRDSVFPTISSGTTTKLVLISTPNGLNHFYQTWQNSINKKNQFKRVFVNWKDVPGRDEKWKQATLQSMDNDLDKFAQEYEGQFLGSSGTLISGAKLKELGSGEEPIESSEGLCMYERPVERHIYAIVCDVSEGKGMDFSTIQCIDVSSVPYRQVCVFRSNSLTTYDFAAIVFRVARSYNDAVVLMETNDVGREAAIHLYEDFEYENMIWTKNKGSKGKHIASSGDLGIRINHSTKAIGCAILKQLIEGDKLLIRDISTIFELSTFSKKGKSYEAEEGKKDDMVMPLVNFGWMSTQDYFRDLTDVAVREKIKERTEDDLNESLSPFGFVDEGTQEEVEAFPDALPGDKWFVQF